MTADWAVNTGRAAGIAGVVAGIRNAVFNLANQIARALSSNIVRQAAGSGSGAGGSGGGGDDDGGDDNGGDDDDPREPERRPSLNQMDREVQRGHAPRDVTRIDRGHPSHGEQPHVHFKNGHALNRDGTWKHGGRALSSRETQWLRRWGWNV